MKCNIYISRILALCFVFICSNISHSQIPINECDFASPVKHKVRLSGSFGELRPNHFHAGIDIKTSNGVVGDAILSAEKGYIARIKIQSAGYGRSIYIRHPNGYTTVYAHLSKFRPDIEKYVRDQQYKQKMFGLNLYPSQAKFKLNKGDEIGKMGNSGSSHGAHLHFEIRETKSEIPCNPLKFKAFVADTKRPVIKELKIYGLDQNFHTINSISKSISKSSTHQDTITMEAWRIGLAIRVHDQSNGSINKNGIYSIVMKVDGRQHYKFTTDKCGFGETRYINAHMDYEERVLHKKYWHKCFILPANKLSMYDRNGRTGVFDLYQRRPRKVYLEVTDAHGNMVNYTFWVKRKKEIKNPKSVSFQFYLKYIEDNYLTISDISFYVPKGGLYQDAYVSVKPLHPVDKENTFKIGSKTTPLHKYAMLTIKLEDKKYLSNKLVLTQYNKKNKRYKSFGGKISGKTFKVSLREMGEFKLQFDTIPPKIRVISFANHIDKNGSIKLKITDNFDPVGRAKDLRHEASIDGKWILMEYDLKSKTIKHLLDGRTSKGEHKFQLVVRDDRNNISKFEKTFIVR